MRPCFTWSWPVPNLVYDNPFTVYKLGNAASFRPEWDVPSINEVVSDRVGQAIDEVRDRDHVDDAQKILLLLGAPGYGKTHLFGRIRHRQHRKVQFVFVPQIIDARRPGAHIRWHLVESLFEADPGNLPPLVSLMGQL